jgi:hypothetical protein
MSIGRRSGSEYIFPVTQMSLFSHDTYFPPKTGNKCNVISDSVLENWGNERYFVPILPIAISEHFREYTSRREFIGSTCEYRVSRHLSEPWAQIPFFLFLSYRNSVFYISPAPMPAPRSPPAGNTSNRLRSFANYPISETCFWWFSWHWRNAQSLLDVCREAFPFHLLLRSNRNTVYHSTRFSDGPCD